MGMPMPRLSANTVIVLLCFSGLMATTSLAGPSVDPSCRGNSPNKTCAAPDTTPPSVLLTSPGTGATVSAQVAVNGNASDNVGVVGVQFKLDGNLLGAEDTTAPYSTSWDTTKATNAQHTLTAVARDAAGNSSTSAAITVSVNNASVAPLDTTAPSVLLTSPGTGATVSAQVAVNGNASDNVGVMGVQFKLDGNVLGAEDTTAPYSTSWDTTKATNAQHTLTAVARDAAGNSSTSAVTVAVANSSTVPSGTKLTWAPPALTSPITITVPNTNGYVSMDTSKDYIVKVGNLSACGGLTLEGGHNVVVIGGQISMNSTCSSAYDRTGVKVRDSTGTVHIEGLLLDGSLLHDGIVTAAPKATLQLENIRVSGTHTIDSNHPDCFQAQGGIGALRVDHFTCVTELQGFFLGDQAGPIGPVTMTHTNTIGSPGRNLWWKSDTRPTSPPVNLTDCWLYMANPWAPDLNYWVYPNGDGDTLYPWSDPSRKARLSADGLYVDFPNTNITGGLRRGNPTGGDFVPASTVGTGYVSPGYVGA